MRYFTRKGYDIRPAGGDKIIVAPKNDDAARQRHQVRIGHKYCGHPGDELLPAYLAAIHRAFGVTRSDILSGS